MPVRQLAALLTALLITGPTALPAAAMTLSCGPSLCFEFDEGQTAVATLGLPVRVGDSMQFLPPLFLAQSAGGSGPAQLAATFVFERVFAVGGGEILGLQVRQEGDYEIAGGGSVLASLGLTAWSNLGADQASTAQSFNASGVSPGPALWQVSAALAPAAAFGGPATDLRLAVDFLLQANTAGPGEFAFAQTKFILGEGAAVPAPGALALFATAAGLCAARARKRRS